MGSRLRDIVTIREALFPDEEPTFRGDPRDMPPELWRDLLPEFRARLSDPTSAQQVARVRSIANNGGWPLELVPGPVDHVDVEDDVVDAIQEKEKSRFDMIELDLSDQPDGEE